MSEAIEAVKRARDFLEGTARSVREKTPDRAEFFQDMADGLGLALAEMVNLKGLTSALPPDLGNIYDLPPELLEELSIAKTDELEDQIVTVVNAYGGTASLDQILVGLFRKFQIAQKRRFIQNKLYRMEMVWSVDGRKGVYTTTKPDIQPETKNEEVKPAPGMLDEEIPF